MTKNPLKSIRQFGQSIWYDNIQRSMIESGALQRLIDEDDVRGVTSNPSIFDKAISKSTDYDEAIRSHIEEGKSTEEIYWNLVTRDITDAADIFLPVYEESRGQDGYISIEVSPLLAYNTEATIAQGRELFNRLGRKNIMIKVPATSAGVPAIKALIGEGIPVNATLIFSIGRYCEVMNAYLEGQEEFLAGDHPGEPPASVASFFISRLDSDVDKILEDKIAAAPDQTERLRSMMGKAAVANSRLAYQEFKRVFSAALGKGIAGAGNGFQRPLWASTSTKNPAYPDTLYVDELIGPHSVNTVPPATLDAYRDHGKPASRIEAEVEQAGKDLGALAAEGVDLNQVTQTLEEKGVQLFADSFNQLIKHLEEKREKLAVG